MWTGTPADIGVSLPLEPATFDLVVVDEADHLDLGAVLPLLYRADRAVLIGAPQGAARTTPLETDRGPGEAGAGLPTWATTYTVSALGGLSDWVRESGGAITQLSDHFRSHPVIADYLSTAFYDRSMVVHSNFRKLREGVSEDLLGLHWHEVGVGFSADGDGAVMESELSAVEGLLQKWDKAGVFELAPRRSIGISSQVAAQIDQLRENIRRGSYSTGVHERVTVAGPDAFVGRQIDLLIVLTGITGEQNPALPEDHAKDVRFYRDALASARLGVHVIGNREACKEAAGCLASLAAYCSGVAMEDDDEPRYDDEFERRLDSAFASESDDDKDPLPLLKDHLNQVGLPYQEYVTELDMPMLLRVLAPLGGRYNIELAKPIDSIRSERELLREIDRDEKISALGYCVLRLTPEEILKKAEYLLERLQRLV